MEVRRINEWKTIDYKEMHRDESRSNAAKDTSREDQCGFIGRKELSKKLVY